MGLIPTKKRKAEKDQKEEWNSFWKNRFMQGFVDVARRYNVFMDDMFIFSRFKSIGSFCELGCGSSILLVKMSKRSNQVVGIDYSDAALAKSRSFLNKNKVKNFRLIKGDARDLKMKEKFDLVYSNGLIEHFDDPGKIILEHIKITNKGGTAIIAAPSKYIFKNLWYRLSRLPGLSKTWLWTDQIFFTKRTMEEAYLKHCGKLGLRYSVSYLYPTEDVILVIENE
ncbi:MAG: class I SAM-dependent methyltransferase [Candidatus Woesearchaeota archaeon]|nr:class I SAM-dependent methyltransferase [Candidatus Woesearchaeota archaeon]